MTSTRRAAGRHRAHLGSGLGESLGALRKAIPTVTAAAKVAQLALRFKSPVCVFMSCERSGMRGGSMPFPSTRADADAAFSNPAHTASLARHGTLKVIFHVFRESCASDEK